MKKKLYLALLMAAMLSVAGCGKKGTSEAVSIPEPTNAPAVSQAIEITPEAETAPEEVSEQTDETGVYYGSKDITELNIGTDIAKCTLKVPLNYIISGAGYLQDDSQQWISGLGGTVTVEDGLKGGELSKVVTNIFTITSLDAKPTGVDAVVYDTANVGSYEDLKKSFPDGKDIGTADNPVWMYNAPESSYDPKADFVILMPVSGDAVLTVYYSGPLMDEIGKEAAAQRVSNLVTKK